MLASPRPHFEICGAAMWVYWAGSQKSQRVAWFLVLLLGMHYGAMLYALYVWKKGQIKRIPTDAGL